MKTLYKCLTCVLLLTCLVIATPLKTLGNDKTDIRFEGSGTYKEPYLITSYDDLKQLKKYVDEGDSFSNTYFKQTGDIEIKDKWWSPIGLEEERCFEGTYDGNGFKIENLNIKDAEQSEFVGLFGILKGRVANICIESGTIKGRNAGAIAGKLNGYNTCIINCYNKASVEGDNAGGIVSQVYGGTVAVCINIAEVNGENAYGILCNAMDAKIYACHSSNIRVAPQDIVVQSSHKINETNIESNDFAHELTIFSCLSKHIFGKLTDDITVLQWTISDGKMTFSNEKKTILLFEFLDSYALLVVLVVVIILLCLSIRKNGVSGYLKKHKKSYQTMCVVSLVISFFYNVASVNTPLKYYNLGKLSFRLAINCICLLCIVIGLKTNYFKDIVKKEHKIILKLLILILPVVFLEILQYGNMPRYDGNIYYGSLNRAFQLFDLGFISYISSFVCWKWIHGLVLFIAPFEYILPGRSLGVYISSTLITIITIYLLYKVLKKMYKNISDLMSILTIAVFIFSPYILGLFSYFSIEWQLPFFAIWLLYAILIDNDYMICFCGYLLCFTKITGAVFYVAVLIVVALYDILNGKKKNIVKNFVLCFSFKKVILWILPALAFLGSNVWGKYIFAQNFLGAYDPKEQIKLFNKLQIVNTFLQSFVFGFRWLLVVIIFLAVAKKIVKKYKKSHLTLDGNRIIVGVFFAVFCIVSMLCVYNSDASCPRYTTMVGLAYVLVLPWSIMEIIKDRKKQMGILITILLLHCVQTYYTIDPAITMYCKGINTGVKEIYRLAYNGDYRAGMNLGADVSEEYVMICDIYSYNNEYSFYESLVNDFYNDMVQSESLPVYTLNILSYEINLSGRGNEPYNIYWDYGEKYRTFISSDESSLLLKPQVMYTDNIMNDDEYTKNLPDEFWVVSPGRVETVEFEGQLNEKGFECIKQNQYENHYGNMKAFHYKRRN